jgi:hypothetical protein
MEEMLYAFGLMLIEVGVSFVFILDISHFNHDTTTFCDCVFYCFSLSLRLNKIPLIDAIHTSLYGKISVCFPIKLLI